MKPIEILADNFLKAYYANTREEYRTYARKLIRQLEKDEWQFRNIEQNYQVAKALYYLNVQDDNEEISTDTNCSIYKLMYYCLLQNYISSTEQDNINSLISGSKLALIILCEQAEYFMYGILVGELGYMPNYAQKHIRDQIKLFGGIVKEYGLSRFNELNDSFINTRYAEMASELTPHFPTGIRLESYKTGCVSTIKEIANDLGAKFVSLKKTNGGKYNQKKN